MSFFTPRREPRHCSRPCSRFFLSCLKVPLAHRHTRPSILDFDGEDSDDDYDRMVTLTVGEFAMKAAKVRRQLTMATRSSLNSVVSPMAGELFIAGAKGTKGLDEEEEESEEAFLSAGSRCSSVSRDVYFSPEGSRCSSVKSSVEVVGWESLGRRSILEELCHCEGWPFGLYRKGALLLPPLPKSPSDSWSWHNKAGTKMRKLP